MRHEFIGYEFHEVVGVRVKWLMVVTLISLVLLVIGASLHNDCVLVAGVGMFAGIWLVCQTIRPIDGGDEK